MLLQSNMKIKTLSSIGYHCALIRFKFGALVVVINCSSQLHLSGRQRVTLYKEKERKELRSDRMAKAYQNLMH